MVKEGDLPFNAEPGDPKLDDAEARARMVKDLRARAGAALGYVLPIQRWNAAASDPRWRSEKWKLRRGGLFLVAGDSPVGFRLPLSSLPWVPPSAYPFTMRRTRWSRAAICLRRSSRRRTRRRHWRTAAKPTAAGGADRQDRVEQVAVEGAVRTALSIEPRDGALCVFMPPVEKLEDYLELVEPSNAAPELESGCISKAIRRRSILASASSRRRPIPA